MGVNQLPTFDQVEIDKLPAQLDALLSEARAAIQAIEADERAPGWESVLAPLEDIDDRLDRFWSVVSHLNAVTNSPQLREVYAQCQPLINGFHNELGQNRALYERARALADSDTVLSGEARKALDNLLRDFRLTGVALEGEERERFKQLKLRLSELSTQFDNQLLDATQGWEKIITDADELAGVPPAALDSLRESAAQKGIEGYRLSLDIPVYLPVMQYADSRELRRELYEAFTTRASDAGPNAGRWDNSETMVEILQLRAEMASLLGYADYAEVSLAPKMAESPAQVLAFLRELAAKSRGRAVQEYRELADFAIAKGDKDLQAWDVPYYSEKLRSERYAISQEQLRPYFPLPRVLDGLFSVCATLFGLSFEAHDDAPSWHEDVRCYRVLREGEQVATVYTDLYARNNKRGGAWMANYCGRRRLNGDHQNPVAFVNCNFGSPTAERPSLLTHNEVTTLFHEFGHALHHMLTDVDVLAVSGINGVPWDAVELPSQLLENWCWEPEVIPLISGHYESGEALPAEYLERMLAAKNFQSGLQMVRQLEFALFDLLLHSPSLHGKKPPRSAADIQAVLDAVRKEVAVYQVPAFNRFQHSFAHIFAGGYAAGYYSYKWAELLSADVFSAFEERGVMEPAVGREFLDELLSRGGAEDPMQLFRNFRGREPSPEPMLKSAGIVGGEAA